MNCWTNHEKAKSKITVVEKNISLKFKYLKFKNKIEKNKIIILILLILIVKEKIERRNIKTTWLYLSGVVIFLISKNLIK
jgi:hypothetical protein